MQDDLLASALFHTYMIPLSTFHATSGEIIPNPILSYDFRLLLSSEIPNTDWLYESHQTHDVRFHTSSLNFLWICFPNKIMDYLIGPISISSLNRRQVQSALMSKHFSYDDVEKLTEIYLQIPVLPYLELQRLINFLQYLILKEPPGTAIFQSLNIKNSSRYSEDESYYTQERNFVASRKTERRIKEMVSNGDVEKIKQFNQHMVPKIGHLSNSPIRQVQNSFIVFMTIVGRAAIDGGLPIEIIHPLTDSYILQCESLTVINKVWELHRTMLIDVTQRVKDFKYKLTYSNLINRCCGYILANMNSAMKIQDIASYLLVNAEYLSRRFKKETSISITQYIHTAKIAESKELLKYTEMTLSQIAAKLGFSSQSQFTTIFKSETGMTPGHYRQNI